MKINRYLWAVLLCVAALLMTSCHNRKFHINGSIKNAKDSVLYLENIGLDGPVKVDSVKLGDDGSFQFDENALDTITPDFYRLRIAGQFISLAIDSTETVTVNASYPTMASNYDVSGSDECTKIQELTYMQMQLQGQINAVVANENMSMDQTQAAIGQLLAQYKDKVMRNYIFKAPMKAYAYYALFQTYTLNGMVNLIFNPRASNEDVKVYAAVATSWDSYYPGAARGQNLHNIALEGMKDLRIMQANQQEAQVDASKASVAGCIDLPLYDNHGQLRHLTDLKGKVVMLEFHLFASKESVRQIMMMRDLYNKYHSRGFEIYQVSVDPDEHFWKTQTTALPWICVRDEDGLQGRSVQAYNVQDVPTFFIIDKNNTLQKRDVQIDNLDAYIQSLL